MEKYIEVTLLYDFYGKLLTKKQGSIVDYYYNENLSLGEIAEKIDMTRQGVYDQLKRAEEMLYTYEEKLELIEKYNYNIEHIEGAIEKINSVENKYDEVKDILMSAKQDLYDVLKQL